VELEWDEQKQETNIANHGIDFIDAYRIFDQPMLFRPDHRFHYSEERCTALGKLGEAFIGLHDSRQTNAYHFNKKSQSARKENL